MDGLAVSEFDRVRLLFRDIDYQRPAVFTVLKGTQAGWAFVDRRDRPAVALIWSDFCYLAGRASDALFNADFPGFLHAGVMPRAEHLLIYGFTDD